MKHIQYIILILFAALLSACENGKQPSHEAVEEKHEEAESAIVELSNAQLKNAGIELGKIQRKQISGLIKVSGLLDVPPQQLHSVSAPLGGFLKSTSLLQGSRVTKGQVAAMIENPEYILLQQEYLEVKSELTYAKADYERQKTLAEAEVAAQKTLQKALAVYEGLQAKQSGLAAKLKLININPSKVSGATISATAPVYAPISGYVTEVNANMGKFLNPNDVLLEIADTKHLHAELRVFEKDAARLRIGQNVRFLLTDESAERLATVNLIGREVSSEGTVRVHCHLEREDTQLLPGMYIQARIETQGGEVTALPDDAIVDFQGKKYIFIPLKEENNQEKEENEKAGAGHGQQFQLKEVRTGNSEFGYTEFTLPEGMTDASDVVIRGAYELLSQLKNGEEEGHAH